jgi:putative protease
MYTRDPGMENCTLTDETGASFPVYKDSRGYSHILNSVDLNLIDLIPELGGSGVSSIGLDLRKRPASVVKTVGEMCTDPNDKARARLKEMCGGNTTRGLYARKV